MKNRIYLLFGILIISCLNQALYAAGLIQELNIFNVKLTNLAKKITEGGPGRPLPPTPPGKPVIPPPPSGKPIVPPPEKSFEPKFTKFFRVEYGQDLQGSLKQIKIGFVADGSLVVYGPELTDAMPEDFIVKHEIEVPGEEGKLPEIKIVDRLAFPANKAKSIEWSSNKRIIKEGPLKDFVLVKAADYQALTEQEKVARAAKNVLYKFYEVYLKTEKTPTPISNWWVTRDWFLEKLKERKTPVEPTGPAEPLNLDNIGDALQEIYFTAYKNPTLLVIEKLHEDGFIKKVFSDKEKSDYSKLSNEEKRERFMLLETKYKDPKTDKYFNLIGLLNHFLGLVSSDDYTLLSSWRIRVHHEDYKWPNLK